MFLGDHMTCVIGMIELVSAWGVNPDRVANGIINKNCYSLALLLCLLLTGIIIGEGERKHWE